MVPITDPLRPVPRGFATGEFALRPITAADAEADHAALMETREELRSWEQTAWPEDDFTVEANREDLAGLEQRHREHRAYTYTVTEPGGGQCLGCVYVFPTEATFLAKSTVTAVTADAWADVEAVVYFWVRRTRMETRMDERLLSELRTWFSGGEWDLQNVVFVTSELFTHQVELIQRTDLGLEFELEEPGKPARYLVYG